MVLDVAIVGAGPGGLSAAARAKALGLTYVLLEASPAPANTIQRYQRGKHVMAEPAVVPLRSDMSFAAGAREQVLGTWQRELESLGIDIRYGSEVTAIDSRDGEFELRLVSGDVLASKHVILAIGLQGNPRKLGVAGEDVAPVQYTLDDPDEYRDETIVIVGAGDAAIENALGLAGHNKVVLINRRDEFARAKEGNLRAITRAIEQKKIECVFGST
ncbi:MAG: NAD(P)/FAD-dependent oxidoreductase, partial [Gammaproteobacteria bacterium]|nr:NAD(P)/FAD-dependent oxidoreductase [Gammaproteobacteria bacterium]